MLLIFDLDGTLFQTAECALSAVFRLCDEFSLPHPTKAQIAENIGKTSAEFLPAILPPESDFEQAGRRFLELEQAEVKEHGKLFPGVSELLEKLHAEGHSLCICSNGSTEYIDLVLRSTGIRDYFDGLYSSKFSSKGDTVKNLISIGEPAILIGDTVSDMVAANENHIPFIGAAYGYGNLSGMSLAFTATSASEISGFIAQIRAFCHITRNLIVDGKRIIGINGVDTSGKTVFTDRLSAFLSALGIQNAVLHLDDFHNPSAIRKTGKTEIDAYYDNAFNHAQIIGEILSPLRREGSLHKDVVCLNLDTDNYENIVRFDLAEDTVLLIEGVLLFRPPIDEYFDGRVLLTISFDEVLRRAELRDVPKYGIAFLQKYKDKYIPIQKRYFSEHSPAEKSDIVIDNENYLNPIVIK
jgi:phosphoglycolate phosphatase